MEVLLYSSIVLLIGTNAFWVVTVHRLVNKLMSRNFAEYNQVIQGPQAATPQIIDLEEQREQDTILKELNSLLPS